MKDPTMQQQMAEMQSAMQNKGLQDRMAALKDDPELAPMFEDIQKNGMQAMMKYWNNPKVLAKIGERMGDIPTSAPAEGAAAAAAAPAAAAQAPAPEINDLRDAAKYGDLEAVEDFIAVGKDVNESDQDGRTALHYAVAYNHADIAAELISSGASLEAQDSKQNSVLHYACGYGRSNLVRLLLEKGAQSASENTSGQTPLELVT
ncbi:hypothetical protein CVIRNUC_003075 [Coccomyxa viridis]|uniref:STI1/HOP DP domain-containing protein n=1 Tax=Coccomyxa viridis TaxID=1274662 RepID=A0AAV1I193_9CHLO|nr:hypothetical protein CVIRNUC_003075 [Coccomyxa viridis]